MTPWWWLVPAALADGQVRVVVRDRSDGDPVRDALVSTEVGAAARTGADGAATVQVAPGTLVTVSAPGFAGLTIPVGDAELEVWLTPAPDLEVVVESFRITPHPARHAVDAEQAWETPGNHDDAVRLVQSLPGVTVQREYAPSAGDLSIRGSAPGDSRYTLDGVEIPYLYHYNQYASVFPASQLESLELYPSTFSAAFGDAVGGIVEARTPLEPPATVHGSASASFVMAGADVAAPVGDGWWVSAAARRSYFDLAGERSEQFPRWPRFHDFMARVERGDADRGFGMFSWGAGDGYARAAGELDALDPLEQDQTPSLSYRRAFQVVGARHHWTDGASGTGRVVVALVHHDRRAELSDLGSERDRSLALTSRLDVSGRIAEDWRGELGWEIRPTYGHLDVAPAGPDGVLVAEEAPFLARDTAVDAAGARAQLAGYGTATWSVGNVRMMPGIRLGADSAGGGALVEPRIGAHLRAAEQTALKLGAGRYLQRPDSVELLAGSSLPTTRSWQIAGGVEQTVSGRWELGLDTYRKWLRDPLLARVDAAPVALPRGDAWGIELVTRYRLREALFLWAWVAWSRATLERASGDTLPADGDQPITAGAVASWELGRFQLGLRYRYGSGLPWTPVAGSVYDATRDAWTPIPASENSARMPAFQKVDARVTHTWTFRGWTAELALEVWYVPKASAQLFPVWSYDYREQGFVVGPTVLPLLGARARF